VADDAINAIEHEMLMVRHPTSKPPDFSKPARYRKERGLVTRLRTGGLWGSGKKYWNSGTDTARRDFAAAALTHVKAQGYPNQKWTEVFFTKAHDPDHHVLADDEYEDEEDEDPRYHRAHTFGVTNTELYHWIYLRY